MKISTVHGIQRYLKKFSGFSGRTINSVIFALGYDPLHGTQKDFRELSEIFMDCSRNGAIMGFDGFTYYPDTVKFYKKHQDDIVLHMENTAIKTDTDIISMVLNSNEFRYSDDPPTISMVGKSLWDKKLCCPKLYELYNYYAWYTLLQVSYTWHVYLINNPDVKAQLAA